MSSIAESINLAEYPSMQNPDFPAAQLKAPFFLRCAALCIDYMLLLMVPILWLMYSVYFGDGPAAGSLSVTVWLFTVIIWVIDFLALPLFRGQTLGKMVAGLSIVKKDGSPARLGSIVLRNVVGYLLTISTLGIGFLVAAVNTSGRALHDYVAGTVVVHARRRLN